MSLKKGTISVDFMSSLESSVGDLREGVTSSHSPILIT